MSKAKSRPKPKSEPPRLLLPSDRRPRGRPERWTPDEEVGYVDHGGMFAEPEAVDVDTQADISAQGRARHQILHAEEERRREMRSVLGRLRAAAISQIKAGRDPLPEMQRFADQLENA